MDACNSFCVLTLGLCVEERERERRRMGERERESTFVTWWHGEWNDKQKPVLSMSVA